MTENFVEREFKEVPGGYYENDFYYTPNGSFWDADGYYFNRDGYDKHGGYYDDNFIYIPGQGWNEEKGRYESENTAGDYYDDYDEDDDLDGDDIPYDPNFRDFDYYDDEFSEEAYLDKNDPTIEKIVLNSNQITTKDDLIDNVDKTLQQSKNSENKPSAAQNTTNIGKAINPKPKINESTLPSLDNNWSNIQNQEKNTASDKKPAEEKPKTGLAALFAKDSNKSKTTAAPNKDAKNTVNAVPTQAKKEDNAQAQSQKESSSRKKSENVPSANNTTNIKSENASQSNQEKKVQEQTQKGGLSALLNPDKNKQTKTPNKAAEKEKPIEEAHKEPAKTTPINNENLTNDDKKIEDSPINLNINKESIPDNNAIIDAINTNNEAEKTEDAKATQNANTNLPVKEKPKKIMILNKNTERNKTNNIQTTPNENLINTINSNLEEKTLTKELEELNIKATTVEQQNEENPEFPNASETNNNNYNYYQDDEFDRSKYSKDIPIANSNDFYRSNNNNSKRISNKRNPGENQMMKIRKNPSNDLNDNFNTAILNNNNDDFNQNRNFNNNNKFYQNNNRNNYNNNNPNFNYQNNRNNPNMAKDQQMNKFNNYNKINNNNNFNNRRFNNNSNNNFDNNNQMNYGNKKFNPQNQTNFPNFPAPYNMPPMNPNIPNSTFINNYNTSLSINYPHMPQMGGLPLNQFPNQVFDDLTANPKNVKNSAQQQNQAYFPQMNSFAQNQAAFYNQQHQMLLQNQPNVGNKNYKANPQNNFQNPQFPVNAMNMNYTNAAGFQQGMYQQNMGFMGVPSNPLLNQRAYVNMPIGGNIENSPGRVKGNLNN